MTDDLHHHHPRARTKVHIEIIRELRIRDFNWKEVAEHLGYSSEKVVHRLLRHAGVRIP